MNLQDWGAIGEVVGALAVVITLIYLAKQIGQNTHAMDEARKLALAQTYQMRSDALQAMLVRAADSEYIGPIIIKLTELGYPEDVEAAAFRALALIASAPGNDVMLKITKAMMLTTNTHVCLMPRSSRFQ